MSKYNRIANRQLKIWEKVEELAKERPLFNSEGMRFKTKKEQNDFIKQKNFNSRMKEALIGASPKRYKCPSCETIFTGEKYSPGRRSACPICRSNRPFRRVR